MVLLPQPPWWASQGEWSCSFGLEYDTAAPHDGPAPAGTKQTCLGVPVPRHHPGRGEHWAAGVADKGHRDARRNRGGTQGLVMRKAAKAQKSLSLRPPFWHTPGMRAATPRRAAPRQARATVLGAQLPGWCPQVPLRSKGRAGRGGRGVQDSTNTHVTTMTHRPNSFLHSLCGASPA